MHGRSLGRYENLMKKIWLGSRHGCPISLYVLNMPCSFFPDRHAIVDGDVDASLATADVVVEGELKVLS